MWKKNNLDITVHVAELSARVDIPVELNHDRSPPRLQGPFRTRPEILFN